MAAPPALGALGMAFTVMRGLQFASLIILIGLTSNFVSETVTSGYEAPGALVGTLVVGCISVVYLVISYILYWDSMLPMLIAAGADLGMTVALVVAACIVGRPVSYLSCKSFSNKGGNTAKFISSLFLNIKRLHGNVFQWVDGGKVSCYEIKAVWGISIALAVLFFFSTVCCLCLWRRLRSQPPPPKDFE